MTERNAIRLKEQLQQLCFGDGVSQLDRYRQTNEREFSIYIIRQANQDQLLYGLRFKKSDNNIFLLKEYELTMRRVPIQQTTIAGIDIADLESRMRQADDLYNQYAADTIGITRSELVKSIQRDIEVLRKGAGEAFGIVRKLVFKYWNAHEYGYMLSLFDQDAFAARYESTLVAAVDGKHTLTALAAYQKIKEMNKEHAISDEALDIIQMAIDRNENWMAYNSSLYFIDKKDICFFKNKHPAKEFTANNTSDHDRFHVMHVKSIADVLRQIPYGEIVAKQLSNSTNLSIMNEKNFEYLKDNIKYMGFGEKQNETLEQHLKEGKESFQLTFIADINKKPFEAVLQFRKSDNSDMYFFNSYHASLERNNGEKVEQPFYLNKGKGVTAKEAYNLLEGRAVHKELNNKDGEPYKAWIQLDFENKDKHDNNKVNQYHEKYGYDLKEAVSKFAIAELNDAEKEKSLLQSLQKGNIQSVTIEKDGASHKMFIEANPQYKTVNLYDGQMKRVQKESLEQYRSIILSKETAVKQEQQQEVKPEMKQGKEVKNGKVQKNDSLLPKKRTRQKKGLGLN